MITTTNNDRAMFGKGLSHRAVHGGALGRTVDILNLKQLNWYSGYVSLSSEGMKRKTTSSLYEVMRAVGGWMEKV